MDELDRLFTHETDWRSGDAVANLADVQRRLHGQLGQPHPHLPPLPSLVVPPEIKEGDL